MLKLIILLVLCDVHNTCYGDTSESDWRSRGWYRPRRNYASQSQSHHTFGPRNAGYNQNSDNQKPGAEFTHTFGSASYNQKPQPQSPFGSFGQKAQAQNTFGTSYNQSPEQSLFSDRQNAQSQNFQNIFDTKSSGSSLENGFKSNAQNRRSFGNSVSQNSRADYPQNTQSQNSFGFGYNQLQSQNSFRTSQTQNTFEANYNQQPQAQNTFGFRQNSQSAFGSYSQNTRSQNSFGSVGQNAHEFKNVTSNNLNSGSASSSFARGQSNFKGPEYLPPHEKPKPPYIAPDYLPSKDPTTTTRRPYSTTTTTRRPFYTVTTTRRPFYTTTTTRGPFFTTTTTRRPFYTTTTTSERSKITSFFPLPAMAMPVPPELEDDDNTSLVPDRRVMKPTGQVGPAMAMPVPPEPEDDLTTQKPLRPDDSPLNSDSDRKPPEPKEPAMTTTTTLPPTTTTPPPTTTSTTPITTTTTPPPTTTTTTPLPTTTITTTTTTPPPTTPPPTTTSTAPTTTTTTSNPDRMLMEETPKITTTSATVPPPSVPYKAQEYLPPNKTSLLLPSPAMAMPVPPEPECDPLDPSTYPYPMDSDHRSFGEVPCAPPPTTTTTPAPTTTTTKDPDRVLIEETPKTTTTIPPTDLYKAPEYLPPKKVPSLPPSPAMAVPVPPEPECDPLDPSSYPYPLDVDQRSLGQDPCTFVPLRPTTKKPFMGPAYLPPAVNTRIGRSPRTLRLADVKGARPVWHAGLYTKTTRPFKQICGGSIVRMDVVITAAHCVWNDDRFLEPAENYAVGANKVYRPWTEPHDKRAQQSDVREIIVPPRFRGGKTSFQDDIAILKLVTPFTYARGLRPVCINFDDEFDMEQLSEGNSGTVAGWGYTDDVGSPTQYLLWLELPYVDIEKCIAGADDGFLKYITSDKICAGENHTGKALCKGDSGGGLVFWHGEGELVSPYLRGIASASARANNKECNVDVVGGFTQIAAHRRFLLRHLPEIDLNCRYHYIN